MNTDRPLQLNKSSYYLQKNKEKESKINEVLSLTINKVLTE